MLFRAAAAALLVVVVANPVLAFVCAAKCAEPAAPRESTNPGRHAHHSDAASHERLQSVPSGLDAPVVSAGRATACGSHADVALAAPERASAAAGPAPTSFQPAESTAPAARAVQFIEQRPPPADSTAATPLRI